MQIRHALLEKPEEKAVVILADGRFKSRAAPQSAFIWIAPAVNILRIPYSPDFCWAPARI